MLPYVIFLKHDLVFEDIIKNLPGAHAPSKPEIVVRGRHEIHVTWKPPEVPLGRINRYDLVVNGEVVYSGMDLHYTARRLRPDTEYVFVVCIFMTFNILLMKSQEFDIVLYISSRWQP